MLVYQRVPPAQACFEACLKHAKHAVIRNIQLQGADPFSESDSKH